MGQTDFKVCWATPRCGPISYSGRGSVLIAIEFPIPLFLSRLTSRRATTARNDLSNAVSEYEANRQSQEKQHD
jgi:hypothetical protein